MKRKHLVIFLKVLAAAMVLVPLTAIGILVAALIISEKPYTEYYRVKTVSGRNYCVPHKVSGFFDMHRDNLILLFEGPDIQPITKHRSDYEGGADGDHWRLVTATVVPQSQYQPWAKRVEFLRKGQHVSVLADQDYGLKHYTQPDGHKFKTFPDIWHEEQNGQIVTYLWCHDDGGVPYPWCGMYFDVQPDLAFKVHFVKRFLPQWQAIKNSLIESVEGLACEIDPSTGRKMGERP